MSTISTLYDALSTFITTNINSGLTETYVKLPNPYQVSDNPEILTNKGFALAFAEGQPLAEGDFVSCKMAVQRDFELAIYQQVYASDFDTTTRNTQEKALFEDWFKVVKAIYQDPTIDGAVANAQYVSDSGLLFADEGLPGRFFLITTVFSITYFESLDA